MSQHHRHLLLHCCHNDSSDSSSRLFPSIHRPQESIHFVRPPIHSILLVIIVHMPPGRKQKNNKVFKTSNSYVHPSLAVREATPTRASSSEPAPPTSVNEQINHLRRTQGLRVTPSNLLGELKSRPVPSSASRRRFAGPPPPRSWLQGDDTERRIFKYGAVGRWRPDRPHDVLYFPFPGATAVSNASLVHHSLKAMAKNFDWHIEYDHVYLSVLPSELKELLLSYVASLRPYPTMSISAMKLLFVEDEPTDGSEVVENVRRLDLGGSAGRAFTIKQLEKFLRIKATPVAGVSLADTWDADLSLAATARFPHLRLLSLAHPGEGVSWVDLLSLARYLGAITHLSLAYWPKPGLPSSGATEVSMTTSASDDMSEIADAAYILKLFSRATPSLQYLSLEGCGKWLRALTHVPSLSTPSRRRHARSADFGIPATLESDIDGDGNSIWTSSWRHMRELCLSQGWVPQELQPRFLFRLFSARSGQVLSSTIQVPTTPIIPAPATALQPRAFPTLRDVATPHPPAHVATESAQPHYESYTVTAPASIAKSIQAGTHRREWSWLEVDAVAVGQKIAEVRKQHGQKPCLIDYGWNKEDLLDLGYVEEDLFHAGF